LRAKKVPAGLNKITNVFGISVVQVRRFKKKGINETIKYYSTY
jgi:hypothetical protein